MDVSGRTGRRSVLLVLPLWLALMSPACGAEKGRMDHTEKAEWKKLTPEQERVVVHRGTEAPFTGRYTDHFETGTYGCVRCGAPLFASGAKFHSGCGWPSFDEALPGAVREVPDADGHRTEIVCARCGGHLGHVFRGEGFTPRNARHCVNSVSLEFAAATPAPATAVFASGCFWGTEYQLQQLPGVISTRVGYSGGHRENPTYREVCAGATGHVEAVEVTYDPARLSYEDLARRFFETHDFSQVDGQGPDIGPQYRSVLFWRDGAQREAGEKLIRLLKEKGYRVATRLQPASRFWPAEEYHQDYYARSGGTPYCHVYRKVF